MPPQACSKTRQLSAWTEARRLLDLTVTMGVHYDNWRGFDGMSTLGTGTLVGQLHARTMPSAPAYRSSITRFPTVSSSETARQFTYEMATTLRRGPTKQTFSFVMIPTSPAIAERKTSRSIAAKGPVAFD